MLALVADKNTMIPGAAETFDGVIDPAFDGASVAFRGGGASVQGIYTNRSGSLAVVADTNTPSPEDPGNFLGAITMPSISAGNVAFSATAGGQQGIYVSLPDGSLKKVIGVSDPLDGKTLSSLSLSIGGALSRDQIVFGAEFSDGSAGVFVASLGLAVPALSTWGHLALVSCLIGFGVVYRRSLR